MRKIRFHGRGVLCLLEGTVLLFLCFSVLVACSGEVYDPSAGTLYLEEGSDRGEPVTDAQTGSLLEIPSFDDPFADAAHILRAEFLNTGESDAILLQVGDVVILLDTGESDDYASIRGRMDAYGITRIDHLVISHFDNDHIGSAAQILQDFAVGTVYMPDYVRESVLYRRMMGTLEALSDVTVCRVIEDMTIDLPYGCMRINPTKLYESGLVLGSDNSHAAEENNFSLITTVEFGEINLLLLGDAEQDRLLEFMATQGDSCAYDLIKIPHHGGYDKALGDLLRMNSELRYCMVHAGNASLVEANLVTAMRSVGAAAYFTYDGTVSFATDGVSMIVEQK